MLHFSLRVSPAEEAGFIISVSKKTAKQAVTRNRIKRRLRAALAPYRATLKPASYLIIAHRGAESIRSEALRQELAILLERR